MNTGILWSLFGLAAALIVDQALGAAIAYKRGEFSWSELPRTLANNILPYFVPLLVIGILASLEGSAATGFLGIYSALAAGYGAKLMAEIGGKVRELYGV